MSNAHTRRAIFLTHTMTYPIMYPLKHTITYPWKKHKKDKYGLIYINRLNADFNKTGTIRIKTARNLLRNIKDGLESIKKSELILIQNMQDTLTMISTNRDNPYVLDTQLDQLLDTFAHDLKTLMQRAELSNAIKSKHNGIQAIAFSPSTSKTLKSQTLNNKNRVNAPRRVRPELPDVPPRTHRKRNNMLSRVTERFVEALTFVVSLVILIIDESPTTPADSGNPPDRKARPGTNSKNQRKH